MEGVASQEEKKAPTLLKQFEMVRFSVAIPAYKKSFLAEAIESVLSQTYNDLELVIVDDCSPENLNTIVEKYNDKRIKYYRNNKNFGAIDVVDNWNTCLSYCKGDYVICMGDDDRLLPCCLYEYSKLIEKYPNLNVYHAWTRIINEEGNVSMVLEPRPEFEDAFALVYYRWTGRRQYIGDFCFKTCHLREYGGYYKLPLAWGADDITSVRAAICGGIANTDKVCFEYRVNKMTISRGVSYTETKLKATLAEKEWYDGLFRDLDADSLTIRENWYVKRLRTIESTVFRRRMVDDIINDINANGTRFFYWMFKVRRFGIKSTYLIKRLIGRKFGIA